MEYTNPLGEEKVSKLLLKYSIPAIVGMMVNALYNIVDRIFIGNSSDLGRNGLAGITIGFPLMIILMSFGILFGVGGATLFSMKLGEGNKKDAGLALGNAFYMLIISGVILTILGQVFLKPLLLLFGASETVLPFSVEYMRVIFIGATFQVISMGMNNFIRADGNPKIAMLTMFIGAGINIILDPIFIYVFRMGMAGAALATIISQSISAIWVVLYFIGKHSKIKLTIKNMKPKFKIITKITALGIPGFALQIANSVLNAVLNKSLFIYGGDIAVSGMGVINSIQTILLMPIIGLYQGAQPIMSFNFGAKKYKRVKEVIKLAIIAATAIVLFGFLITRLFPEQLISVFNKDSEMLEFGSLAVNIWFLCLPLIGFQIVASNFFQAIGKSKSAMFLTLTRQVILLIPALLIFPLYKQLDGLLYAAPFADFFSFLITAVWFYYGIKKLSNNPVEELNPQLSATSLNDI